MCSIGFETLLNMSQCFSAFTVGSNLEISDARKFSIVGYGLFFFSSLFYVNVDRYQWFLKLDSYIFLLLCL